MKVLVINCGSSSIKYQLFDMPTKDVLAKGVVERIGDSGSALNHKVGEIKHECEVDAPTHTQGMAVILKTLTDSEMGVIDDIAEIGAVGHRLVHGGETYSGSILIDEDVLKCVEEYSDLAPLHNPPNLIGVREAQAALPGVPMVAVFDTAFHQTIPAKAHLYALPYELYEKYRVRKYGFHGTSHAYVTHRAAELLGKSVEETSVITCHLGNGASVAAIQNGQCVDTTMGMTPLPGLVMGTRCGDIDPAIIFYLLGKEEFSDYHDLDALLNKKSGLLGISQISNDMRTLKAEAEKQGEGGHAQLALDIFSYRLCFYIGAYMGILEKVDAIIFTGGIGENNADIRTDACKNLANVGVMVDPVKNSEILFGKEGNVAAADSSVNVFVIPTDEEGWIATETFSLCS